MTNATARLQTIAQNLNVGRFVELNLQDATGTARYLLDGRAIGGTARDAEKTIRAMARK